MASTIRRGQLPKMEEYKKKVLEAVAFYKRPATISMIAKYFRDHDYKVSRTSTWRACEELAKNGCLAGDTMITSKDGRSFKTFRLP